MEEIKPLKMEIYLPQFCVLYDCIFTVFNITADEI